jgi:hypothetical protein
MERREKIRMVDVWRESGAMVGKNLVKRKGGDKKRERREGYLYPTGGERVS